MTVKLLVLSLLSLQSQKINATLLRYPSVSPPSSLYDEDYEPEQREQHVAGRVESEAEQQQQQHRMLPTWYIQNGKSPAISSNSVSIYHIAFDQPYSVNIFADLDCTSNTETDIFNQQSSASPSGIENEIEITTDLTLDFGQLDNSNVWYDVDNRYSMIRFCMQVSLSDGSSGHTVVKQETAYTIQVDRHQGFNAIDIATLYATSAPTKAPVEPSPDVVMVTTEAVMTMGGVDQSTPEEQLVPVLEQSIQATLDAASQRRDRDLFVVAAASKISSSTVTVLGIDWSSSGDCIVDFEVVTMISCASACTAADAEEAGSSTLSEITETLTESIESGAFVSTLQEEAVQSGLGSSFENVSVDASSLEATVEVVVQSEAPTPSPDDVVGDDDDCDPSSITIIFGRMREYIVKGRNVFH